MLLFNGLGISKNILTVKEIAPLSAVIAAAFVKYLSIDHDFCMGCFNRFDNCGSVAGNFYNEAPNRLWYVLQF